MSSIQECVAKHLCHACICDQFLAAEVKAQCVPGQCGYCGDTRDGITLEDLADRIHEALEEHFKLTPDYPDGPYEYVQHKEGTWERRGDLAEEVIAEMGGLDEGIAGDLTALLSDKHSHWAIREEGSEDPYGSEAMYERREPNDLAFRYTWTEFRREIRSRSRFFGAKAEDMLHFIFGDLTAHIAIDNKTVIREISPDEEEISIWRARTAQSTEDLDVILKSPSREMGPPPSKLAKAGRMNPQGIPVFYGAMDQSTCVSEVRAPVGSYVVVGRFELLQAIRLLDLDVLANVYAKGSYFDLDYSGQEGRVEFFKHLVNEISRPVMPQDEALAYLSTQVVAEYLAHKTNPPIDGIIFRSSQTGGEGRNLVLFSHACGVEPYNLPIGTDLRVYFPHADEDGEYGDFLVIETMPPDPLEEDPQTGTERRQRGPIRLFEGDEQDEAEHYSKPTLRLDVKSLEVLDIKSVTYASSSRIVRRNTQTAEEADHWAKKF